MKVGDTVYVFDYNHREYEKDANGRSIGGPIYTKHFVETKIVGETTRSWIVERWDRKYKKKPQHFMNGVLTWAQVLEQVYINDHSYRIAETVRRIDDAYTLKNVAKLIGYDESKR